MPLKLLEFFYGAHELHGAVVQEKLTCPMRHQHSTINDYTK